MTLWPRKTALRLGSSFGSAHSSGCHFVFCDGAVRLIAYRVNPTTYSYLGSRSDDEALDMAEF